MIFFYTLKKTDLLIFALFLWRVASKFAKSANMAQNFKNSLEVFKIAKL